MADFREDLGAILSPNLANNRIESEPETIRGEGSGNLPTIDVLGWVELLLSTPLIQSILNRL